MSCGLEHLSNCHGEVTAVALFVSAGGLWFRMKYDEIKTWIQVKLEYWRK